MLLKKIIQDSRGRGVSVSKNIVPNFGQIMWIWLYKLIRSRFMKQWITQLVGLKLKPNKDLVVITNIMPHVLCYTDHDKTTLYKVYEPVDTLKGADCEIFTMQI